MTVSLIIKGGIHLHKHKDLLYSIKTFPIKNTILICLVYFLSFTCSIPLVNACTAWEVAGDYVNGTGTLLAKNRDYTYGEYNYLKVVDNGGYKFLGLYANTGNKGGVNEKGLSVLSLSAPAHWAHQKDLTTTDDLTKFNITWILEHYSSVDETLAALKNANWHTHPQFLAIADSQKIAYIEFGPYGMYSIKSTSNGTLAHTNHYLEDDLLQFNPDKAGYESIRYEKALEQLSSSSTISFDDLKNFTQDPVVWYKHAKLMTYSSFIINSQPNGAIKIWIKIENPGNEPFIDAFDLADVFSGKVSIPQ